MDEVFQHGTLEVKKLTCLAVILTSVSVLNSAAFSFLTGVERESLGASEAALILAT